MKYFNHLDMALRERTQTLLIWLGERWGLTREKVVRTSGLLWAVIPTLAFISFLKPMNPLALSVGLLTSILANGFLYLLTAIVGLRALEKNEQWGTYSNWMNLRWLRVLEIFFAPIIVAFIFYEALVIGDYMELANLFRPIFIVIMLYALTCNELPPRKSRKVTSGAREEARAVAK